jgi:hypothetical protein
MSSMLNFIYLLISSSSYEFTNTSTLFFKYQLFSVVSTLKPFQAIHLLLTSLQPFTWVHHTSSTSPLTPHPSPLPAAHHQWTQLLPTFTLTVHDKESNRRLQISTLRWPPRLLQVYMDHCHDNGQPSWDQNSGANICAWHLAQIFCWGWAQVFLVQNCDLWSCLHSFLKHFYRLMTSFHHTPMHLCHTGKIFV